jgi:hypothetical protein
MNIIWQDIKCGWYAIYDWWFVTERLIKLKSMLNRCDKLIYVYGAPGRYRKARPPFYIVPLSEQGLIITDKYGMRTYRRNGYFGDIQNIDKSKALYICNEKMLTKQELREKHELAVDKYLLMLQGMIYEKYGRIRRRLKEEYKNMYAKQTQV